MALLQLWTQIAHAAAIIGMANRNRLSTKFVSEKTLDWAKCFSLETSSRTRHCCNYEHKFCMQQPKMGMTNGNPRSAKYVSTSILSFKALYNILGLSIWYLWSAWFMILCSCPQSSLIPKPLPLWLLLWWLLVYANKSQKKVFWTKTSLCSSHPVKACITRV